MENTATKKPEAEKHEVTIVVNTREKTWNKKTISYQELIMLAFGEYIDDPNIVYTVSYTRGEEPKHEGTLVKGAEVKVKKDMSFDVTLTDRS